MTATPGSSQDTIPPIAVVDDDEAVRLSLLVVLQRLGRPVRTYICAEDFFDCHPTDWPACVVLDINLPGMSGWSAIEALRARGCHSPVVAISGRRLHPDEARTRGAAAALEKPLCPTTLIGIVEGFLADGTTGARP